MGHWTPRGIKPTDYDDDDESSQAVIIKLSAFLESHLA